MSPEQEAPLCVFCRKHPVETRWRPFCSERCKLQDLAHWADGTYRVAAEPVDPAAGAGEDDTDTSESDGA
jgi:uncharacterized protein